MHLRICAALLLIAPAAFANSVDLKTQLLSCQHIADEEQRLSCFDQIVSRLNTMPVVVKEVAKQATTSAVPAVISTAPVASPVNPASTPEQAPLTIQPAPASQPAPVQQSAVVEFGLNAPDPVEEVDQITAVVKTTEFNKRKQLLITLENGQQWQQIDQDYLNIKAGDTCIIKKGSFGSFLLGVSGYNRTIRVRRVE
jgi:hypothetical protein